MKKTTIKAISIAIVTLLIVGAVLGVVGYYSNGFKNWDKFNPVNWFNKSSTVKSEMPASGMYVNPGLDSGISLISTAIAMSDFNAYNIPDTTDSAYKLTATINSTQTRNFQIDWTISWQNYSDWSIGKNVEDYLTLSSKTSLSGESVSLICKQDFAEKIKIVATANLDKAKRSVCVVDYIKKIKSVVYKIDGNEVLINDNALLQYDFDRTTSSAMNLVCEPVFSNYTIDTDYTISITGKFTDTFGYNQDIQLNTFEFAKGINFSEIAMVSDIAKEFVECCYIVKAYQETESSMSAVPVNYYCSNVLPKHEKLTEADKQNKYVAMCCKFVELVGTVTKFTDGGTLFLAFDKANPNNEPYNFDIKKCNFMNIEFLDIEDFINKAIECANEMRGIAEYTITLFNEKFSIVKTFEIGYSSSSFEFFNGSIELPPHIEI